MRCFRGDSRGRETCNGGSWTQDRRAETGCGGVKAGINIFRMHEEGGSPPDQDQISFRDRCYAFFFFYCCSSTVLCHPLTTPHSLSHQPSQPPSPVSTPSWFCLCVLYRCSCKPFLPSPRYPLPLPLLLLSVFIVRFLFVEGQINLRGSMISQTDINYQFEYRFSNLLTP